MLRKLYHILYVLSELTSRPVVVLATSLETAHPVVVEVDSDPSVPVVLVDSVDPRSAT